MNDLNNQFDLHVLDSEDCERMGLPTGYVGKYMQKQHSTGCGFGTYRIYDSLNAATVATPVTNDTYRASSIHQLDVRRLMIDYEIRSSWWASWISNKWLQNLVASHFARKAIRKISRWEQSCRDAERLKAMMAKVD